MLLFVEHDPQIINTFSIGYAIYRIGGHDLNI